MKKQTICFAIFVMLAVASNATMIEDVSRVAKSLVSVIKIADVCPCRRWPCTCEGLVEANEANCMKEYPPLDPNVYYGETGCQVCKGGYRKMCSHQWISYCQCV